MLVYKSIFRKFLKEKKIKRVKTVMYYFTKDKTLEKYISVEKILEILKRRTSCIWHTCHLIFIDDNKNFIRYIILDKRFNELIKKLDLIWEL